MLLVLFASARGLAGFWVESLWFSSVGHSSVFWDVVKTKVLLGTAFTIGFVAISYASLSIADRLAPIVRHDGPEEQALQRYRDVVGHRQGLVWFGASLLFGLIAGVPAASQWQSWMLFRSAGDFGVADAQFGADVGFYVFRLPFLSYLVNWLFAAFMVITFLTAVAHYTNGGIRLQPGGRRVTSHVKLHLSGLAAMLAVLKAADYWLQRYSLATSTRGYTDGASFTDIKAQLPALQLLILISLLAAALFIVNVWQRGWRLPVIAVGLWAIVASIAGTAYPAFVQRFQVESSESTREAPYIARNIAATREAFGLTSADVTRVPFDAGEITAEQVEKAAPALADVRLLDPRSVEQAFGKLQGLRTGYRIGNIDVDRYVVDGRMQQVLIAARELDQGNLPLTTWEGQHLAFTHGYGLAIAPAGEVTQPGGRPVFRQVTSADNEFGITRPEIYFGDGLAGYSVVNTNREGGEESLDPKNPPYAGAGGVSLSSGLRRAAYALHFGEYNLFGSRLVTEQSRIIYHRDISDRVRRLAPFLSLDSNPYPVAYGGRVVWIVDAYTTTTRYPYSQRANRTQLPKGADLARESFNYVRNSVKAVVDAYDGSVTLYVVDETDPIIKAWKRAFPRLFSPADSIPPGLREHFRYPEDLFTVQTNHFGLYQIDSPQEYYSQKLAWSVAQEAPIEQLRATSPSGGIDPNAPQTTVSNAGRSAGSDTARFAPYYTLLRQPGTDPKSPAEFVLLRPFVPFSNKDDRLELQAFMTASGDSSSYGKLTAYVLDSRSRPLPDGPLTVASALSSRISSVLTLEDQAGSQIRFGDMQLVPVGNGLLYIRPWFRQAEGTSVPELRAVSVTYRARSEIGDTLADALGKLFPGVELDLGGNGSGGSSTTPEPSDPSTPNDATTAEEKLSQAEELFRQAQEAKRNFDSKLYQSKIEQAYALVREAAELSLGEPITIADTGAAAPTTTETAPPTTATA